jgi:hypothetical protein
MKRHVSATSFGTTLDLPNASAPDLVYSYAHSKYSYTVSSGKANQALLRSSRLYETQHIRHISSLSDTVAMVMLAHVLPYRPRHQNGRVASSAVRLLFIKGSYVKASKLSAARCTGADILPLLPEPVKSLVCKIIKG